MIASLLKNFKIDTKNFYTWASGIKAPFYNDNRLILSQTTARNLIIDKFVEKIKLLKIDLLAGVVTSGLPYASIIADRLNLPLIYVRSGSKDHGTKKLIEGSINPKDRVVVIEDLFSSGNSALNAALTLKKEQLEIIEVMAIFSYELNSMDMSFKKENIKYSYLCSFKELMKEALKQKLIKDEDLKIIETWRKQYAL